MRRPKVNAHYFLAQFLPLAVMVLGAAAFLYYDRIDAELRRLQQEQREYVALGAATLTNDLDSPLRYLSILVHEAPVLKALDDATPANIAIMGENFASLMQRNPDYDRIRWIDENGKERVHVEKNGTTPNLGLAHSARLQSDKERQFFAEVMTLPTGNILISPMDLHRENDKIQLPHKPTVRVAIPVSSSQRQARGILSMTVLMAPMLDRFSSQVERSSNRAMLLNGDGYWLYSTNSADEWGFMFNRDVRLGKNYPKVWQRIESESNGSVINEDGIWTWQHVAVNRNNNKAGVIQQSPWTVVLHLPQQRILIDRYRLLMRLGGFVGLILMVLAALSWQLAVHRKRRELAVLDRLKTETELIASQQRINDLLRHQEARSMLAAIVASSDEAIIGTDLDELITSWNPGASKLFGYSTSEIRDQSIYLLVPQEKTSEARNIIAQIREGDAVVTFETVRRHKDGHLLDISVTVSPIFDDYKKIIGISYIARNISQRKRLEEELSLYRKHLEQLVEQQTKDLLDTNRHLELALSKAEAATRAKSNFLSNMSHEIRTPMNAVLGLTYLLERSGLQSEQQDLVGKIIFAGQSLLNIINDVLDVSKIEAGRLELEHVPFRLSTVLENVTNLAAPGIGDKDVELVIDYEDKTVDYLHGDALRLEQILLNLTSNAIKFTAQGNISIHISVLHRLGEQVTLRFAVTDTGTGIALERQQDIFKAFTQGDSSTTRRYGGTGLGLAICRHLVQLMQGEIGVVSAPGKGSQFWFTLPLQLLPQELEKSAIDGALVMSLGHDSRDAVMARVAADSRNNRLQGARVLVVDDSEINCEVAKRILEADGAQVHTVADGSEAVQWLGQHAKEVDVVLMDIQMPVMDGYSATHEIRHTLKLTNLPIIALTAGAFKAQEEAALAAGMNAFLSKPYNVEQIIALMRQYIAPPPATEIAQHKTVASATSNTIAEQTHAGPGTPAASDHPGSAQPSLVDIDISVGLEAWGNEALYKKFLGKFVEQYDKTGSDIVHLIETNELTAAKVITHKLRGSAGTLALNATHHLAGELEILLTEAAIDACKLKAEELDQVLHSALAAIVAYTAQT